MFCTLRSHTRNMRISTSSSTCQKEFIKPLFSVPDPSSVTFMFLFIPCFFCRRELKRSKPRCGEIFFQWVREFWRWNLLPQSVECSCGVSVMRPEGIGDGDLRVVEDEPFRVETEGGGCTTD